MQKTAHGLITKITKAQKSQKMLCGLRALVTYVTVPSAVTAR